MENNSPYSVYFIDDHTILREGLVLIFQMNPGFQIVGQAGTAELAHLEIFHLQPDLIVLDISLPGKSGLELASEIRTKLPLTKIILLSRHDQFEYIQKAKKIGVHAYVLKDEAGKDLVDAAKSVMDGFYYLSPRLMTKANHHRDEHDLEQNDTDKLKLLTPREREILRLIAEGLNDIQLGEELKIKPKTAKIHRQNIMDKLDIHKATELVLFANKNL